MKKGTVNTIIWIAAAYLTLSGCTRELEGPETVADRISFEALTSWQNDGKTRTEYSGQFNTVTGEGRYERIDWVTGKDRIRIFCAKAYDGSAASGHASDYTVTTPTSTSNEKSIAHITPVTGNGLRWGTGMHYFYALYPAPGTKWKYDESQVVGSEASIGNATNNQAVISGTIPAVQAVAWNSSQKEYEPNMNYAYMYAATAVSARNDVTLTFKPLVTSLQFTIKAADANAAGLTLIGFKLKSDASANPLAGTFTATLSTASGTPSVGTPTNASHEITLSIPSNQQRPLSQNDLIKITVLALPVELTKLSIELTFTNGVTRSLDLKARANGSQTYSWITIPARSKAYINSLGVPSNPFTYTFTYFSSNISVPYYGGLATLASSFQSYRSNGVTDVAVPFTLQYSTDGTNWSNTPPSWLSTAGMNTNGGKTGQSFTASIAAQRDVNDTHHAVLANSSRAKTDFNLAKVNVASFNWISGTPNSSITTANCYVVQGSGTFKFPLVYGNGVQNGIVMECAYRGHRGVNTSWREDEGYSTNTSDGIMRFLGRFRDHNDNLITSPYMTTQLGKSASDFTPVIIWQDVPGLVRNLGITGTGQNTYLTFSVPAETITQGNALIAVKVDGKIAWSWHIWVTDEDMTACKLGPVSSIDTQYSIAPVNIGWCDGKDDESYPSRICYVRATQAESGFIRTAEITQKSGSVSSSHYGNNPFFQFGRKDPLQASDGTPVEGWGGSNKIYYYSSDYYYSHTSTKQTIGTAIQHPTTHYSPGSADYQDDHWCSTSWLNLWSAAMNATGFGQNGNAQTKTIYDPSPVGFRVPSMDVYEEFGPDNFPYATYTSSVPYRKGRTYTNGLHYPATGFRASSDGDLGHIGEDTHYWSAQPCGTSSGREISLAYDLYFNTGSSVYTRNWNYCASRAANAFPVRPVKE